MLLHDLYVIFPSNIQKDAPDVITFSFFFVRSSSFFLFLKRHRSPECISTIIIIFLCACRGVSSSFFMKGSCCKRGAALFIPNCF